LADKSGQETTSDGSYKLYIKGSTTSKIYWQSKNVTKPEFQKAKLGMGSFEHEGIIYDIGRIPYSSMGIIPKSLSGNVIVDFKTLENRTLTGDSTIFF
jgi:hypothetical protein